MKINNKVDVLFTNGDVLYDCTLTHKPEFSGDLWGVKDSQGVEHLINPYSSTFEEFRISISDKDSLGGK